MEKSKPIDTSSRLRSLESWHVAPSNSQNFDFLDGIRGIAILLVVFSHLFYINPESTGIVQFVGQTIGAGHIGVTVFFTLSGFLISLPFWKNKTLDRPLNLKNYFSRRFWKIYPPLALSIIILLPCYVWLYGDAWDYTAIALKWLSGVAWLIPVSGMFNPVMWSMIVEVHFYILLPLLFLLLRKVNDQTSIWLIFGSLLLVPLVAKFIYAANGVEFALHPMIRVNFPVKMDSFAAGVLIAGMYQQGLLNARVALLGPLGIILLASTLLMAGVSAMLPSLAAFWTPDVSHYCAMIASACLLCFVANPLLAANWGLCFGWLRWVGLVSYEWYLLHQAPHLWLRDSMGPAEGNILKYLTMTLLPFIGTLVIAAAVYWKYSLPILRKHRT